MKQSSLSDDDIRRLLDAVATDGSITLPNKEVLRRRIVDEFQMSSSTLTQTTGEQSAQGPVTLELSIDVLPEKHPIPWRRICLSAAATVLAVLGVLTLARRTDRDTISAVADETQPIVIRPVNALGLLNPGHYSLDSVAGGIEFATTSSVTVTQLNPGLIVLQAAPGDSTASLWIMSADNSIEEVLEGHRETGVIELIRAAASSRDGPITEFEVRLQPGELGDGCEGETICLRIGRATIESGSVATVREFLGPDDRRVWALYQSEGYLDPFLRQANLIQESIELSSES